MISSLGSGSSQIDLASLLKSGSNSQQTQRAGDKPPDPAEMFKQMDTDSDGSVTETEFSTAMEKMKESGNSRPPPPPDGAEPPDPAELFAQIDSDSDGQISLAELKTDFESRKPNDSAGDSSTNVLGKLFEKLDSDSDGQIGETEFKKLLDVLGQSREQTLGTTYGRNASSSTALDTTSLLGRA